MLNLNTNSTTSPIFTSSNEIKSSTKKVEKDNNKLLNGLLEFLDTFETINVLTNKITDKDLRKNFEVSNDIYKQTTEDLGIAIGN